MLTVKWKVQVRFLGLNWIIFLSEYVKKMWMMNFFCSIKKDTKSTLVNKYDAYKMIFLAALLNGGYVFKLKPKDTSSNPVHKYEAAYGASRRTFSRPLGGCRRQGWCVMHHLNKWIVQRRSSVRKREGLSTSEAAALSRLAVTLFIFTEKTRY